MVSIDAGSFNMSNVMLRLKTVAWLP
jgi:hypothetical protein